MADETTPRKRRPVYPQTVKSRRGVAGQPAGVPLTETVKQAALVVLLRLIDKGEPTTQAVRALATRYGCHEHAIWRLLGPYRRSTTAAATWVLKASALDMAKKVVAEGKPAELIDVLSRPNLGVLAPAVKGGGESGRGLFISVQIGSCGGAVAVQEVVEGEVREGPVRAALGAHDAEAEPVLAR